MLEYKFTCERCGAILFTKEGFNDLPKEWSQNKGRDLCPQCTTALRKLEDSFEEMRKEFWEGK